MRIQFRPYNPRGSSRKVIDQANAILSEAAEDGWHSMTLRQLYYQFVARGLIPNAIREYKRLGTIMTAARYGGLVSWTALEDAGRVSYNFPDRPTAEEVLDGIQYQLRIDPWQDQEYYLEVWVEKQALEATIARPCSALRTSYMACKGYLSASEAWRAASRFQKAVEQGKKPVLLHLGDHDPSGIDMTRDNGHRMAEFLGEDVLEVKRLALNMDQVTQYNPPPNPAKETDSRFVGYKKKFGDTSWELDALRQNDIGELITNAIQDHIDQDAWAASLEEEDKRRKPLAALTRAWGSVEEFLGRTDSPLERIRLYDEAMDMGQTLDTAAFLNWIESRIVHVYNEHPGTDFVLSLSERRAALMKARHFEDTNQDDSD